MDSEVSKKQATSMQVPMAYLYFARKSVRRNRSGMVNVGSDVFVLSLVESVSAVGWMEGALLPSVLCACFPSQFELVRCAGPSRTTQTLPLRT